MIEGDYYPYNINIIINHVEKKLIGCKVSVQFPWMDCKPESITFQPGY